MSVMTWTSRITSQKDVSSEYDLSEWNNCIHHGTRPKIMEFTYGSRKNKDRRSTCAEDFECCQVYTTDKKVWNKWHPDLSQETVEYLEFVETDAETKKTTYHFCQPMERLKPEFYPRWEITI